MWPWPLSLRPQRLLVGKQQKRAVAREETQKLLEMLLRARALVLVLERVLTSDEQALRVE